MLEWIEKNRDWVLSGVGLTLVAFLIWAGRSVFHRLKGPRPQVKLNLAIGIGAGIDNSRALTISLVNPTDHEVVIGNFVLELTSRETMFFPTDYITGQLQSKQVVKPGDSCAFHIGIPELRQTGRHFSEFKCALVQTPAGPGYRSTRHELHRFLRHILKGPAESPVRQPG
jgi:hypothetical protein